MNATLDILLADDDKDDCEFFKEALDELSMPANLVAVHDGEQLMRYLGKITDQLPHALFLDLNMPRKNGYACLKEIKGDKQLNNLPIIIYSTSYSEEVADGLYQQCAHHYIRKPAEFSDLKKVIHEALTLVLIENNEKPPKENFLITK